MIQMKKKMYLNRHLKQKGICDNTSVLYRWFYIRMVVAARIIMVYF